MTQADIPIILLAAGASSRMRGRDKLLEEVDGQPLLRRQAELARGATDGPVIVALPPAPHPRYVHLTGLEVLCIEVPDAAEGMNASLRAAFAALPPHATCAMLLLADLPALERGDLQKVAEAVDLTSNMLIWRGATSDGAPGHPIVFKADLFAAFADLTGDGGGREVVIQADDKVTLVPLEGTRARMDLDTPEDWDLWRRRTADGTSVT
ncbi:nucleotidyltransferase family protein [Sulfitobacter sp. TSTF-M16]|uniref:Nucleotidyltransferase family protein n=1 Tax=Sulfitobacter aestuariivivens TaxID=2766981 RepID=A0A927D103_9RHOB|nr:nucleotidyltransferase family protein [Sulfitobacter aestuariivivens]MBD3663090.1 nucleotidyltransferase family protein [Sulfitobacter aestuariivivens]